LNCNTNVSRYVAIQFRGVGDGKQPDVLHRRGAGDCHQRGGGAV
jgi:hypothetical protein